MKWTTIIMDGNGKISDVTLKNFKDSDVEQIMLWDAMTDTAELVNDIWTELALGRAYKHYTHYCKVEFPKTYKNGERRIY